MIVVLLVTQTGKPGKSALIIENYDFISNGIVNYGDTAMLDSNGYIVFDLMPGRYNAKYELTQCTNPSLSYTKTLGSQSLTYDPLKEGVIVGTDGKLQKRTLSASEKAEALMSEEVYVFEVRGTEAQRKVIVGPGSASFGADGATKLSFNSKCPDSSLTFKIYEAD